MILCEQKFLDEFADKQKTYIHHPKWFYLKGGHKYMPDFYCKEDDEYIEVAGTRQAYHANKLKYELFFKEYPRVKLTFVHLWHANKKHLPLPEVTGNCLVSQKTINRLNADLKENSVARLARSIGIIQNTLHRIVHKQSPGSVTTWEKIDSYYRNKKST